MPSFARELEQTLHNALGEASGRKHEYATLEHLLLALTEDVHAGRVMEACGVNLPELSLLGRVLAPRLLAAYTLAIVGVAVAVGYLVPVAAQ